MFSICMLPDVKGFPPSTAVRVSFIVDCFSLSKAFCRTNSADTLPRLLLTSIEKYSFGLILKVLTELMSVSVS
uniref:Uncharacterized protein n=1 Tax=Xiphophorus maculatus TaxID=8083 RepID=A0A3B5Q924_XIPMA